MVAIELTSFGVKYRRSSLAVAAEKRMNLTRLPWLPLLNACAS